MNSEKVTLDEKGLALLGNALLLGYRVPISRQPLVPTERRAREHELWRTVPERYREERGWVSKHDDLRDLLKLAGLLDKRLDGLTQMGGDDFPDPFLERAEKIESLVSSDEEIATLRVGDVDFPMAVAEEYGLSEAIQAADTFEVSTPIARLGPTALNRRVLDLVSAYLRGEIAAQQGISPEVAEFIGWDGVRGRAESQNPKPPNWKRWNSDEARHLRQQDGWIARLRDKAERLILEPVTREYSRDADGEDLEALAQFAISLKPSASVRMSEFHLGLGDLGSRLCLDNADVSQTAETLIGRVFPNYGAAEQGSYDADGDAMNFLFFASSQIAWSAARAGWAICIAEDCIDSGGGIFSWVRPERFSQLSEPGRLALPDELDVRLWVDLDDRATSEVRADRLWFVLTRELAEAKRRASGATGPKNRREKARESKAAEALSALHRSDPDARFQKERVREVCTGYGFSEKAADRIWQLGAPDSWKARGSIKDSVRRFTPEEFEKLLAQFL